MMVWCRNVVCDWDPEHFKQYGKKLTKKGIFHEYRKVTILAGPAEDIGKQRKQTTRKYAGFGQDSHLYKIIRPL